MKPTTFEHVPERRHTIMASGQPVPSNLLPLLFISYREYLMPNWLQLLFLEDGTVAWEQPDEPYAGDHQAGMPVPPNGCRCMGVA